MEAKLQKSAVLNELFGDLHRKHLQPEKKIEKIENAQQGDVTLYISLATLALQSISTLVDVLTLFGRKNPDSLDEKYYIRLIYKNGQEVVLKNLSLQQKIEKLKVIAEQKEDISYLEIG